MTVKRMNILACESIHEGQTNGRNWTIYSVTALNEAGEHIDHKLRSFDELPIGYGLYEITAKEYKGEQQYTLKPAPGDGVSYGQGSPNPNPSPSPGARLGPKVDELRQRLDNTDRVVTQQGDEIAELRAALQKLGAPVSDKPKTADTGDKGVVF